MLTEFSLLGKLSLSLLAMECTNSSMVVKGVSTHFWPFRVLAFKFINLSLEYFCDKAKSKVIQYLHSSLPPWLHHHRGHAGFSPWREERQKVQCGLEWMRRRARKASLNSCGKNKTKTLNVSSYITIGQTKHIISGLYYPIRSRIRAWLKGICFHVSFHKDLLMTCLTVPYNAYNSARREYKLDHLI